MVILTSCPRRSYSAHNLTTLDQRKVGMWGEVSWAYQLVGSGELRSSVIEETVGPGNIEVGKAELVGTGYGPAVWINDTRRSGSEGHWTRRAFSAFDESRPWTSRGVQDIVSKKTKAKVLKIVRDERTGRVPPVVLRNGTCLFRARNGPEWLWRAEGGGEGVGWRMYNCSSRPLDSDAVADPLGPRPRVRTSEYRIKVAEIEWRLSGTTTTSSSCTTNLQKQTVWARAGPASPGPVFFQARRRHEKKFLFDEMRLNGQAFTFNMAFGLSLVCYRSDLPLYLDRGVSHVTPIYSILFRKLRNNYSWYVRNETALPWAAWLDFDQHTTSSGKRSSNEDVPRRGRRDSRRPRRGTSSSDTDAQVVLALNDLEEPSEREHDPLMLRREQLPLPQRAFDVERTYFSPDGSGAAAAGREVDAAGGPAVPMEGGGRSLGHFLGQLIAVLQSKNPGYHAGASFDEDDEPRFKLYSMTHHWAHKLALKLAPEGLPTPDKLLAGFKCLFTREPATEACRSWYQLLETSKLPLPAYTDQTMAGSVRCSSASTVASISRRRTGRHFGAAREDSFHGDAVVEESSYHGRTGSSVTLCPENLLAQVPAAPSGASSSRVPDRRQTGPHPFWSRLSTVWRTVLLLSKFMFNNPYISGVACRVHAARKRILHDGDEDDLFTGDGDHLFTTTPEQTRTLEMQGQFDASQLLLQACSRFGVLRAFRTAKAHVDRVEDVGVVYAPIVFFKH